MKDWGWGEGPGGGAGGGAGAGAEPGGDRILLLAASPPWTQDLRCDSIRAAGLPAPPFPQAPFPVSPGWVAPGQWALQARSPDGGPRAASLCVHPGLGGQRTQGSPRTQVDEAPARDGVGFCLPGAGMPTCPRYSGFTDVTQTAGRPRGW